MGCQAARPCEWWRRRLAGGSTPAQSTPNAMTLWAALRLPRGLRPVSCRGGDTQEQAAHLQGRHLVQWHCRLPDPAALWHCDSVSDHWPRKQRAGGCAPAQWSVSAVIPTQLLGEWLSSAQSLTKHVDFRRSLAIDHQTLHRGIH